MSKEQIEEMACKNCIHYEVCMYVTAQAVEYARAKNCKLFKNNASYRKQSEVIEEYRKKVYSKMEKHTVFGREYIQRIMREVEKEMKGGAE